MPDEEKNKETKKEGRQKEARRKAEGMKGLKKERRKE